MTQPIRIAIVAATVLCATPVAVIGHFKLIEPASWLIENDRGDPQKTGPCGGSNTDWGKPSYVVTKATGGQKLHIKVLETIYHPGHYRVALAVNSPTELPPDPETVTGDGEQGPVSVSAKIQDPPQTPVIADGLFVHATRPTGRWRRLKPTCSCRTSPAGSARCRSCSSWRNTASTTREEYYVPPLRRAADHGRSGEADRQGVAGGAIRTHSQAAARPPQLCLRRYQALNHTTAPCMEPFEPSRSHSLLRRRTRMRTARIRRRVVVRDVFTASQSGRRRSMATTAAKPRVRYATRRP